MSFKINATTLTEAKVAEYFEYLDDLRESGATNMFAATSYLKQDTDCPHPYASAVLSDWMATFDVTEPSARARKIFAEAQS